MRRATLIRLATRLPLALGLLLACGTDLARAQYSLKSRRDYMVGDHPVAVVAADFDADGKSDFITVDKISNYLTLTKGFGDGTFRAVGTVVAGSDPTGLAFIDVNHDGFKDLVVSNSISQDVTVNLGNGLGAFAAKIRTAIATRPFGMTVGDWNADTHVDVATVNSIANTITVMRGNGAGTFANLLTYTVGTNPNFILSADFNADAKADLVVVNTGSNSVQVWRGDGLGAFTLNTTLSTGTGSSPLTAASADLNADTRPDLVVALRDAGTVRVYLANTTGGFNAPTTLTVGDGPRSVAIDDVNKDGKPDLLVGLSLLSGTGAVAVMTQNANGTFAAPSLVPAGPVPTALTSGDFNEDGNLDVVSASLTGNALSILETTGGGAFLIADRIVLTTNSFPTAVTVADFNRDGKPDVACTSQASDQASIARGNGTGGFLAPTNISTGNLSAPQALVAVDPNRDTWPDLVVVNGDNTMSVLMNNGSGTLSATNGITIGTCDSPVSIAAGQINGDVNPDIAYVCEVSYMLCTKRGTGGSGSGAFGPPTCTYLDNVPEGVAIANFNFDTFQDMVISSETNNWADFAFSDGQGGMMDLPSTFPTGPGPRGVAQGDLNNDGYADAVVANANGTTLSALIGDGGGVFSFPSIESPAGEAPTSVALADLNLDGKLDAAVVNTNSNDVSFLLGDGYGHFTKAGDFGVRDQPVSVAAGDFNADTKPDLVVADNYSDTLTILLNQTALGDPLQTVSVVGSTRLVYRWGMVPGAVYDVIRGSINSMNLGVGQNDLGPVTCLADDLPDPDTSALPDSSTPAVGEGFFYLVRAVVGGVPTGPYTMGTNGKPGVPSSGDCF
ncbi:MAG TPA: VCBS repeat-containing protein [Dongiaceae bacterium]|nr:VCBS repeat-containing protein [Dongiaceae bacterium]